MNNKKPLSNILIKPAGPDCNLACDYCFYLDKTGLFQKKSKYRMSVEVLRELMRQLLQQGTQQISVAWQGGEPTLMGVDFFRKAVEFQNQYAAGKMVGNSLQTNGLLIDDRWTSFLREHNSLVGLSIDGPQHIHDHYRKDRGGRGSWEKVVAAATLMLENGVEVNALSTVNTYSVNYPDEIYDYLKALGFRFMQFIPIVETSEDDGGVAPYSVAPRDYGDFLIRLFDRWLADFKYGEPTTSIRYFESLFYRYVNMQPPDCTLMERCGPYVVVEYNGDVYACDFFVEPAWRLGNIMENRLIDLLNSPRQQEFGNQKAELPKKCRNCPWSSFCFGGCPKDRIRDKRTKGLNYFCESVIIFLEYADLRFRRLADKWRRKN
ncbi:MAG: anaerobic sulfatase maturase [Candidatus Marinimicrobia bacterium]|nr:anaerobic sulfatase maturase [bacterium]MCG2716040.1 anaerobic sulfatase maturase [Candidatus Neomarinimicrobiota bacterium]